MRRNWIKIYVDQCLRGTMMDEMTDPGERFIWFGFLLLAGDSPIEGQICITNEMGYSDEQLGALLKCDAKLIKSAKKKMVKHGKIEVLENGVIVICKWSRYQSEYSRQKAYRDPHRPEPIESDIQKLQPEVTTESNDTDRDRDIERDREEEKKENKKEYSDTFEEFWKVYPRKKEKKVAYLAWKEHGIKSRFELIDAAINYRIVCQNTRTDEQYIKHPAVFIRKSKERWKDYLERTEPVRRTGETKKDPDAMPDKLWSKCAAYLYDIGKTEKQVGKFLIKTRVEYKKIKHKITANTFVIDIIEWIEAEAKK